MQSVGIRQAAVSEVEVLCSVPTSILPASGSGREHFRGAGLWGFLGAFCTHSRRSVTTEWRVRTRRPACCGGAGVGGGVHAKTRTVTWEVLVKEAHWIDNQNMWFLILTALHLTL